MGDTGGGHTAVDNDPAATRMVFFRWRWRGVDPDGAATAAAPWRRRWSGGTSGYHRRVSDRAGPGPGSGTGSGKTGWLGDGAGSNSSAGAAGGTRRQRRDGGGAVAGGGPGGGGDRPGAVLRPAVAAVIGDRA